MLVPDCLYAGGHARSREELNLPEVIGSKIVPATGTGSTTTIIAASASMTRPTDVGRLTPPFPLTPLSSLPNLCGQSEPPSARAQRAGNLVESSENELAGGSKSVCKWRHSGAPLRKATAAGEAPRGHEPRVKPPDMHTPPITAEVGTLIVLSTIQSSPASPVITAWCWYTTR